MNTKRTLFIKLLAAIFPIAFWIPAAQATHIVDTKIGEALLANSGDATELAAIKSATGNNNLTLDFKIDVNGNIAMRNPGTTNQWFIDVGPNAPGYFLLKLGIGGTNATANTFFFKNIGELSKLVWTDADVQFLTGGNCRDGNLNACNIGRLSHYNGYNGNGVIKVPEPATLTLFGLGLLGFGAARRRSAKNHNA
jgi:hypothetical protein